MPEEREMSIEGHGMHIVVADSPEDWLPHMRALINNGSVKAFDALLDYSIGDKGASFNSMQETQALKEHVGEELCRLKDEKRLVNLASLLKPEWEYKGNGLITKAMEGKKAYPKLVNTFISKAKSGRSTGVKERGLIGLSYLGTKKAFDEIGKLGARSNTKEIWDRGIGLLAQNAFKDNKPHALEALFKHTLEDPKVTDDKLSKLFEHLRFNLKKNEIIDTVKKHGLNKRNTTAVVNTIRLLELVNNEKAVGLIEEYGIKSKNPHKVSAAVKVLTKLKTRRVIDSILNEKLMEREPEVVSSCLDAFELFKPVWAVDPIIEHGLKSKRSELVFKSVNVLDEYSDKITHTAIIANAIAKYSLPHRNKDIRAESINAINKITGFFKKLDKDIVVPPLIKYGLSHEFLRTKTETVEALAKIGDKRALPPLMTLTGHKNKTFNFVLKRAIKQIQKANK